MEAIGWILIGLVAGLVIGAGVVWMYGAGRTETGSVKKIKEENARFREEVNEHFVQTAELINQLTDSYKAVFDHLSDGADRMVDKEAVRERMPRVSGREVRLKHIGSPEDGDGSKRS